MNRAHARENINGVNDYQSIVGQRDGYYVDSAKAIAWKLSRIHGNAAGDKLAAYCQEYEAALCKVERPRWQYVAAAFERVCSPRLAGDVDETTLTKFVDVLLCEGVSAEVVRWQLRRVRLALKWVVDAGLIPAERFSCKRHARPSRPRIAEGWIMRYQPR